MVKVLYLLSVSLAVDRIKTMVYLFPFLPVSMHETKANIKSSIFSSFTQSPLHFFQYYNPLCHATKI